MIEIDGDLKRGSSCLVGPAGISGPQLDEGQPYEANSLRVLGVQRQMLVAMGYVIGFDSATEIVAGSGQITPPERAHAKEISALCPGDRVMTSPWSRRARASSSQSSKRQPCRRARPRPRRIGGSTGL